MIVEDSREEFSHSPTPKKENEYKRMLNFYDALRKCAEGKRIFKMEWEDQEYFGIMDNTKLMLHKPDGRLHEWTLTIGDLSGDDWIVL